MDRIAFGFRLGKSQHSIRRYAEGLLLGSVLGYCHLDIE